VLGCRLLGRIPRGGTSSDHDQVESLAHVQLLSVCA
jgi:hypothetical protein